MVCQGCSPVHDNDIERAGGNVTRTTAGRIFPGGADRRSPHCSTQVRYARRGAVPHRVDTATCPARNWSNSNALSVHVYSRIGGWQRRALNTPWNIQLAALPPFAAPWAVLGGGMTCCDLAFGVVGLRWYGTGGSGNTWHASFSRCTQYTCTAMAVQPWCGEHQSPVRTSQRGEPHTVPHASGGH